MLYSDNGPCNASSEFSKFVKKWGFTHVTSSPHSAQSNGFIEWCVQTIKNITKKAKKCNEDLEFAMMCVRATPIDSDIATPAELLYNRMIKTNFPIKVNPEKKRVHQVKRRRETKRTL